MGYSRFYQKEDEVRSIFIIFNWIEKRSVVLRDVFGFIGLLSNKNCRS